MFLGEISDFNQSPFCADVSVFKHLLLFYWSALIKNHYHYQFSKRDPQMNFHLVILSIWQTKQKQNHKGRVPGELNCFSIHHYIIVQIFHWFLPNFPRFFLHSCCLMFLLNNSWLNYVWILFQIFNFPWCWSFFSVWVCL